MGEHRGALGGEQPSLGNGVRGVGVGRCIEQVEKKNLLVKSQDCALNWMLRKLHRQVRSTKVAKVNHKAPFSASAGVWAVLIRCAR